MNHHALNCVKLMHHLVPSILLELLETWFASSITCVEWDPRFQPFLTWQLGFVRVVFCRPPCSVSISMMLLKSSAPVVRIAIYLYSVLVFFCYADDILLTAPSVQSLQTLLHLCEAELIYLDLCINSKKSVCIRFGSRLNVNCCSMTTLNGIAWNRLVCATIWA